MHKYRIIPQSGDKFRAILTAMPLDCDFIGQLKASTIKHVEIDVRRNRWEILLNTYQYINEEKLKEAGKYLVSRCGVSGVDFYQDIIDFSSSIEKSWHDICKKAAGDNPAVRVLLNGAVCEVDGNHLIISVRGELAKEILHAHNVRKSLKEAIYDLLDLECAIDFKAIDVDEVEISEIERVVGVAPQAAPKVERPVKKAAARPQVAKRRGGKSVAAGQSDKNYIFGQKGKGTVVEISSIEGEMKNIAVVAQINNLNSRTFNTGTHLITFGLADDTDGVNCKLFIKDDEEFESVFASLKQAKCVKVSGNVRFDSFNNDFVMIPNGIYKYPLARREDHAEKKRVELHAHTHMSNMDAVVSAHDLICQAAAWGWDSIAITDHGVVQAFPEAAKTVHDEKLDIKVIYGMEGYLIEDERQKRADHIILLAKNSVGLRNLYQLVSLAHLKYLQKRPRLPKKIISEYREGLIIGSACEAGELIRAIVSGQSDERLLEIASFYDYLEVQPLGNNEFLLRSDDFPQIQTKEDLQKINLKVAQLAQKLKKPLVATCDVHFLNPQDSIYRAILMSGKGFKDADLQPPLYLRTTEEMLAEFTYLGEDLAREAVIENPRQIAAQIEKIKPIPDDLYSPMIPGADEQIESMSYAKAKELYGEPLPKVVKDRLELELKSIIGHGFAVLYLIAHKLVKKSLDDGYLVGSRGSVGSSFVATMTDITEVNPLPPHWRCPKCHDSEFVTDGSYGCGFDLPDRDCPYCGTPMIKDGHDIPFAVFMGFDGDKVPDIDLNFSGDYQPVAHKYTEELFGKDNVYRAGTIATVADKTAYGYVRGYFNDKGLKKRDPYINKLVLGCTGVKRTTGQHPGGIMVIPRNMDVHHFTPVQRPADDKDTKTITTHFDYHSISSRLVKLDILGHDDPTVIKMLENITHRDPKTIPFDDPATMSLFSSTKALGVSPEELGATSGTFGIPEFRTPFTRQMIDDTCPKKFSDLVRISGFSHGTDVWLGNAQDLIKNGTCTLSDAISARDDIMMYLIHKGIDPLLSFKTMENVRKGRGIKEDVVEKLKEGGIPDWFIESCQKIKYLFPRAHATAYVMMAYRIAFCKVHYPLAFYAAYFSIRADEFDAHLIAQGKKAVRDRLDELVAQEKNKSLSVKEKALQVVLELAWEMYLRGFYIEKVDLYNSLADKFVMHEKSLLPPLSALPGVGKTTAHNIVEARKKGAFSSIDDLKKRAGVPAPSIEIMRLHGCLDGMDETDQIALFNFS